MYISISHSGAKEAVLEQLAATADERQQPFAAVAAQYIKDNAADDSAVSVSLSGSITYSKASPTDI